MTIPGGSESLGFVDNVTVLPTHRRRGIMTQLISAQLRQIHERGETLSALTASESLIYERFGYGVADMGRLLDNPADPHRIQRCRPTREVVWSS